jgi:large conductance mechanosensitive channel
LALVVFLLVKAYNRMRAATPPPAPSSTDVLLMEIRDALKTR